ncbi:GNAT family N-acetyltransferase [Virgibacillus sp. AGTR]|uniref:GNAT family N-acetyltransferase n=1 Tax=Virgibacillus TaxID=84406 RepID=UPI000416AF5B|nr:MULTISPECIES: GNAT family N-acetyltransferase [Bacillaceae]MCC2252414.1 GNAT family N-acetyltransferase [Virgibacillus sp. AGTR]WBX79922.1 GNAT family N-acetyltransferase [Virgibacillus salarius]
MKRSIEMRLFEEEDIKTVQEWFNDHEIQNRLEGMLPLMEWFNNIKENTQYFVWLTLECNQPVGIVMVEIEEDCTGSIALAVKPSLRNKGYGRLFIEKTMLLPDMQSIKRWYAGIEEDNVACLKCFQSVGFTLQHTQPDKHGFYSLIHY